MFPFDFTRRKLAALLRSWLTHDPQLDLRLGFLRSHAIARNLRFDVAALNRVIGGGFGVVVKSVTVEELRIEVDLWSENGVRVGVRGVNVKMVAGEPEGGRGSSVVDDEAVEASLKDWKRKAIARIDPEGSALHDELSKMVTHASSRNGFKDSLRNALMAHCQLELHDAHLWVEFPVSDEPFIWVFDVMRFRTEAEHVEYGGILRGVVGSLFRRLRHSCFTLCFEKVEIRAEKKDLVGCLFSSEQLNVNLRLWDRHLIDFMLFLPEMKISLAPTGVPFMLALWTLFHTETKPTRNGRQLWKIAGHKVGRFFLPSGYLLHKVFVISVLALRLAKAYERFLQILEFPEEESLKKRAVKMLESSDSARLIKQRWKVISDMEYQLPAEAVAWARRLARENASLRAGHDKDAIGSSTGSSLNVFVMLILQLAVFLRAIRKYFENMVTIFSSKKSQAVFCMAHGGRISDIPALRSCLGLNIGKIVAILYPLDVDDIILHHKQNPKSQTAHSALLLFCLLTEEFLFYYEDDIFEHNISFSLERLNVVSTPVFISSVAEKNLRRFSRFMKGNWNQLSADSRTVIWVDSAPTFQNSDGNISSGNEAFPSAEKLVGDMRPMWKRLHMMFHGIENECTRNPWLAFSVKSSMLFSSHNHPGSGLSKCSLAVGKLNLALGYISIRSMSLLFKQKWHAPWHSNVTQSAMILSNSSGALQESEMNCHTRLKFIEEGIKRAICKFIPNKQIELGSVIIGPCLRVSLSEEESVGRGLGINPAPCGDCFILVVIFDNVNLAIWPTSGCKNPRTGDHGGSSMSSGTAKGSDSFEASAANYASQGQMTADCYFKFDGVNAYFESYGGEKSQVKILELKPIAIRISFLSMITADFSVALSAVVEGITVLMSTDELAIIFQVMGEFFPVLSACVAGTTGMDAGSENQASMLDMPMLENESEEMIADDRTCQASDFTSASLIITGSFQLDCLDIILKGSNRTPDKGNVTEVLHANGRMMCLPQLPENGIWLCIEKVVMESSYEAGWAEIHADVMGSQVVIFRFKEHVNPVIDQLKALSKTIQSLDHSCEVSVSGCTFTTMINFTEGPSSSGVGCSPKMINSSFTANERAIDSTPEEDDELNKLALLSGHWLLVSLSVNAVFVGKSSIRNLLVWAHNPYKLQATLCVGGDFQSIYFKAQDGFLFLEAAVLVIFAHSLAMHLQFFMHLLYISSSNSEGIIAPPLGGSVSILDGNHIEEVIQEELKTDSLLNSGFLEVLEVIMSQLSLVFLQADESGRVREIVWNVNLHLNFGLEDAKRKFLFNLDHLNILSQIIDKNWEHSAEAVRIPHFSSAEPSSFSSEMVKEKSLDVQDVEVTMYTDVSGSTSAIPATEPVDTDPLARSGSNSRYILEEFSASASAEKPALRDRSSPPYLDKCWAGSGTCSGLDVTVSLSELKMLMDISVSMSEVFGKLLTRSRQEGAQSFRLEEASSDLEALIPDGAIVAIEDIHQHLYMTVEHMGDKYGLTGSIHYSLVEYQKQRRWNFGSPWFFLVSLHTLSAFGEPMRLTCRSGSGLVHVSDTSNSSFALWRTVSYKPENYEGDISMHPFLLRSKNIFYLVNKKNDCGVSFMDDVPEFVRKPGHPFKFKVFSSASLPPVISNAASVEANNSNSPLLAGQELISRAEVYSSINLKLDKAAFTITHELSQKEVFSLIRGCFGNINVNVQVSHYKTRVMSTFTTVLHYFDANRIQVELVHPIETYIFYRSSFHPQVTRAIHHGASVHLYLRLKEIDVSLTELSLDILLFVIGKLDVAGPFDVKSSSILANSCKVENELGLSLLCQFYDTQTIRVGRKQAAFFHLRNLGSQSSAPSHLSIKLEDLGALSTSSIQLPLSETRAFAWRMRIISAKDTVTYPGPFLVFEVSKNLEEGLSVVVSPLLRVHNVTGLPLELRFQRPEQKEFESAAVLLQAGDTIDDCVAAFDAVNGTGGFKKALVSLSVGNVLFSFRPQIKENIKNSENLSSVEWSEDLKGGKAIGKAILLSGILDKLAYKVRDAFSANTWKCSFSTACCVVRAGDSRPFAMHFLVQSLERDVPIKKPDDGVKGRKSLTAIQEQKEIFLLPTLRVSNLLQLDVRVHVHETDASKPEGLSNIGNEAIIPCGSTIELYANPAIMYFTVTLVALNSSCKPVNSRDWVKMLNKQKDNIQYFDIELEFSGGKYFASLRFTRGVRGTLEAVIFTSYTLKNDTDFPLICLVPNHKSLSRNEAESLNSASYFHLGSSLPSKSTISWFMKSNKLSLKLFAEDASPSMLDLDTLSGLAEIDLSKDGKFGYKHVVKLGVSLGPLTNRMSAPSRIVTFVPRYIVANESDSPIYIRQCFSEDDLQSMVEINSKQKTALVLRDGSLRKREANQFDKFLKKHMFASDDSSNFIQFRPNITGLGWSGPVCVASLGRFFLKFKRSFESAFDSSNRANRTDGSPWEFAVVHVIEEASSFVLRFHRPPSIDLPYRIENRLLNASVTYYQKDTFESESLAADSSTGYVWDDLTRPHKLVIRIDGVDSFQEINLDKLRSWKAFFKTRQQMKLPHYLTQNHEILEERSKLGQSKRLDIGKVGYEVYADGPTRVLRISDVRGTSEGNKGIGSCMKVQFRVSNFAVRLLEHSRQDLEEKDLDPSFSIYSPIILGRLENIDMDSILINQQKHYRVKVQSINIDQKRVGAPFGAMFRKHKQSDSSMDGSILIIVFVLDSTSTSVKKVKRSSILLQPVDLSLDEETLMRIVPFWRASLNQSSSQQYYFDHFEIHPIKVIASFLPEESYSSYSSAQETLRSLLHSVIKIPTIKGLEVELNGVLVTHALVTTRELLVKCAQHYSWYAMRAIYIAKGSQLLPPTFASVFDDLASSSLDVFFDPSSNLLNVQGLTLGTFKLLRKCIERKGFSGTKRYFGDLGKTLKTAGSNILFSAVTEISDSVLKGAESSGFSGMITGFHHGILKLAMEPSFLGTAFVEGGPDRKIKLDRTPGVDELYVEGYLQAMLDTIYKQEYLRVRVIDDQVILKNLPPNSSLIDEIMDRVKDVLIGKGLMMGDSSTVVHPLRHLRGENEWRLGPTVLTLCEHLFVSFAIRMLRKQAGKVVAKFRSSRKLLTHPNESEASGSADTSKQEPKGNHAWRSGIGRFVLSALVAYVDGRLCRGIPNPVARRIVSGFLLSYLDKNDSE
ncbi:Intermembrane lipid transfer protein VPS13-like protein [Drosera capensis]